MKYTSYTKCIGIFENYVVFDVTIYSEYFFKGETKIVCEFNIIIDENLSYNVDGVIIPRTSLDIAGEIECEKENAIKICCNRAEWIFSNKKKN